MNDFLRKLDNNLNKIVYSRITLLDWDENPIKIIQGKVTGGSINVDGTSALRRTCSITMIIDQEIRDFLSAQDFLKTKFKLEIGIFNSIDPQYPDIVWFQQGIFLFTSINFSLTTNGFTLNISGKDKMCLLNGDLGGNIEASVDFGKEQIDNGDGTMTYHYLTLAEIIPKLVFEYSNEKYQNILVNDLAAYGLELLEYRGNTPLYFIKDVNTNRVINMTLDDNVKEQYQAIKKDDNTSRYKIIIKTYGETCGYRPTDLIYAGELICGIGETVTSVLDKIVAMLGNYEYFYDTNGKFIFQRKNTDLKVDLNTVIQLQTNQMESNYIYQFINNQLLTNITVTPQPNNIKNDFIIWGKRLAASGIEVPIHLRVAIDKKPTVYISYENIRYTDATDGGWRELLYQMASDYQKYFYTTDNFLATIATNNPDLYPTGYTGYEQYYMDMFSFWRDIYDNGWKKDFNENPEQFDFWIDFLDVGDNLNKYAVYNIGDRPKVINNDKINAIQYEEIPQSIIGDFVNDPTKSIDDYTLININESMNDLFTISSQGQSTVDQLNILLEQCLNLAETISITSLPIYYLEPNNLINLLCNDQLMDGEYIINRISYNLNYNGTMTINASKRITL